MNKHSRKLFDVRDYQAPPDGLRKVPVIHYGVIGLNSLGNYDVIVELNAFYYHPKAITDAISRKFDVDVSNEKRVKKTVDFQTLNGMETVRRWVCDNEYLNMEIEHTEKADVQQTEGRFVRNDDHYKVIYRFHNVNIQPYPHRTYKSWKTFWKDEFGHIIPTTDRLTGVTKKVWDYINKNIKEHEFN